MPFVVATAVVVVAAVVVVVAAVVVVATAVVVVFHFNKRTWIFFQSFLQKMQKTFFRRRREPCFFQKPVLTGFSRKEFLCKSSKIFLWPILSQSMNGHKFESWEQLFVSAGKLPRVKFVRWPEWSRQNNNCRCNLFRML